MFKTPNILARSTDRLELFLTVVLAAASLGLVAFWLLHVGKLTQEFIWSVRPSFLRLTCDFFRNCRANPRQENRGAAILE